jgi:hypothetical protein
VGRAVGACLSERCVVFFGFFQVLSRIPLIVLGDPMAVPDSIFLQKFNICFFCVY